MVQPSPAEVVAGVEQRQVLEVAWYGGGRRRVETVTRAGLWDKSGRPLVELRWVFVHDLNGTHWDSYFFTTDATVTRCGVWAPACSGSIRSWPGSPRNCQGDGYVPAL